MLKDYLKKVIQSKYFYLTIKIGTDLIFLTVIAEIESNFFISTLPANRWTTGTLQCREETTEKPP